MADSNQLNFQLKISTLELVAEPQTKSTSPTTSKTTHDSAAISSLGTHIVDSFNIGQNDIIYRAEGNANIVFAIPKRYLVLRLPKESNRSPNTSSTHDRSVFVYKYITCISSVFLGSNLSNRPHLVRVEFNNVHSFNTWLHEFRPRQRIKSLNSIDHFEFKYGLLSHDACSLNIERPIPSETVDTLAVEIKPKQGWNICSLQEDLRELLGISGDLRNKCRFCVMQYLKIQGHQAESISNYCPLDLFSGNETRMKSSIRNLIANPQNNFRVFHNGSLAYFYENQEHDLHRILYRYFGNSLNIIDDFIMLLVKILQYDFVHKSVQNQHLAQEREALVSETMENESMGCVQGSLIHLPKDSILHRLLELQLLSKKTIPIIAQNTKSSHQPSNSKRSQICDKLVQADQRTLDAIDYEHLKSSFRLTDEELYEIGATALDCSIMLTIQCAPEHQSNFRTRYPIIYSNGKQFIVNATVFDLDPKLYPQHFSKYVKKTREAFNAYKCYLGTEAI